MVISTLYVMLFKASLTTLNAYHHLITHNLYSTEAYRGTNNDHSTT